MRLTRSRQRTGLRCIRLDVRQTEIARLISMGFLAVDDGDDPEAIGRALEVCWNKVLN